MNREIALALMASVVLPQAVTSARAQDQMPAPVAEHADAEEPGEEEPWNQHLGWYAEVHGGGNATYSLVFDLGGGGDASATGLHGGGWAIVGGYHFGPKFAVELGFMQNFVDLEDADGVGDVSVTLNVPWLAARWDVPLWERWAFIAKLGLMAISVSDKDAEDPVPALPFVGFGASYAVTPSITASVQYQGAVYGVLGAGLLSAGIGYHF